MFDSGTALRKILAQSDRFDFKNILKVFKVFEVLWVSKCDFYYFISLSIFLSLHTNFNNLRNQNTKKKKKKVGTCSFYYWHFLASLTCFESTV